MQALIAGLGRIFLGSVFLFWSLSSILNWDAAMTDLQSHLSLYLTHLVPNSSAILSPWATLLLSLFVAFGILGSICLIFGTGVRFGAFLLLLVLVPTTLIVHHFWSLQGPEREKAFALFMMNVSICGGLLLALAYGGKRSKKAASGTQP